MTDLTPEDKGYRFEEHETLLVRLKITEAAEWPHERKTTIAQAIYTPLAAEFRRAELLNDGVYHVELVPVVVIRLDYA